MAEIIKEAFEEAQRFELYVRLKTYSSGFLLWAALGFLGSFASYLLEVYGRAVEVPTSEIGFAQTGLWTFIIGFGLLKAFSLDPDTHVNLSEKYGSEKYEEINARYSSAGKKLSIAWGLAWLIGFVFSYSMVSLSPFVGEVYLVAIVLSLSLGNLSTYFFFRDAKVSLFTGLFLLLGSPVVAMTVYPFQQLVIGFVIGIPYYISGIYIRFVELPKAHKVSID